MEKQVLEGTRVQTLEVGEFDQGKRVDVFLTEAFQDEQRLICIGYELPPTRSQIGRWIEHGCVSCGKELIRKPSQRLKSGHQIVVVVPEPRLLTLLPDASVTFPIIFEDPSVLVLNKPAGLVVHPGAGQFEGTLVNGLLAHFGDSLEQIGDALRPGIVHRLDKETSGVMVVAKTALAFYSLVSQLQPPRTMTRKYLAFTYRLPKAGSGSYVSPDGRSGSLTLPIGRHPRIRTKMAVVAEAEGGKNAETAWELQEAFAHGFLLSLTLGTGRTHQIRVHLSEAGAPIIGDTVYGGGVPQMLPSGLRAKLKTFSRQALHAYRLSFEHPVTQTKLSFEAEIPEDFRLLDALLRA